MLRLKTKYVILLTTIVIVDTLDHSRKSHHLCIIMKTPSYHINVENEEVRTKTKPFMKRVFCFVFCFFFFSKCCQRVNRVCFLDQPLRWLKLRKQHIYASLLQPSTIIKWDKHWDGVHHMVHEWFPQFSHVTLFKYDCYLTLNFLLSTTLLSTYFFENSRVPNIEKWWMIKKMKIKWWKKKSFLSNSFFLDLIFFLYFSLVDDICFFFNFLLWYTFKF